MDGISDIDLQQEKKREKNEEKGEEGGRHRERIVGNISFSFTILDNQVKAVIFISWTPASSILSETWKGTKQILVNKCLNKNQEISWNWNLIDQEWFHECEKFKKLENIMEQEQTVGHHGVHSGILLAVHYPQTIWWRERGMYEIEFLELIKELLRATYMMNIGK